MKYKEVVQGGYYYAKYANKEFCLNCVIEINAIYDTMPKVVDYTIYDMRGGFVTNGTRYLEELCDHLERRVKPKIK